MIKLKKILVFVNDLKDFDALNLNEINLKESKIYSFNIEVHKILEQKGIEHEIAENYLSEDDRLKIFDSAIFYHQWHKQISNVNEFEFEGINLLGVLDTAELHHLLIQKIYAFFTIKRILEKENPEKILASANSVPIVKELINDKKIDLEIYQETSQQPQVHWDKILFRFNIGNKPVSIPISRNIYYKIKNLFESIIATIFGLWFDFKNKKKTILFLEFNPLAYSDLIRNLSKFDRNIVFLNRRRPAIWNFGSIKLLKNYNCKILNADKILTKEEKEMLDHLVMNI